MSNVILIMNELDLEPIMVKAMDKEEGFGWSLELTQRVTCEYKKFLILCLENPDFPVVPSSQVDDFWHLHILDTQKYQEDCKKYLGYFLHHFPYFGMRGKQDEANLKTAWEESCSLYKKRFGEQPADLWISSRRCPNCGRRSANFTYAMNERPRLKIAVA